MGIIYQTIELQVTLSTSRFFAIDLPEITSNQSVIKATLYKRIYIIGHTASIPAFST